MTSPDKSKTHHANIETNDGQEFSTSSDEEMEMTFYPNGRNHQRKAYYLPASTCPGESKPYTLPEGIMQCPISGCPAHSLHRIFRPPWRLNEHMKTRHGWPRKNTQPNTDRRLSKSLKNERPSASPRTTRQSTARRHSTVSNDTSVTSTGKRKRNDEDDDPAPHADEVSTTFLDSSFAEQSPGCRPRRDRRQTAKGKEMANSMAQLAAATSVRPARKPRHSNDPAENLIDEALAGNQASGESNSTHRTDHAIQTHAHGTPPDKQHNSLTRDHALIAVIKELIHELRVASSTNPELAKSANEYEELIRKDMVHVNCQMSEKTCDILSSCYMRLAERHNARANIFSMAPLPSVDIRHSPVVTTASPPPPKKSPSEPRRRSPSAFQFANHPRRPSPPKTFHFVNDAPSAASRRAALNAVSKLRRDNVNPQASKPPPTADNAAQPIILKLNLNSQKSSRAS